MDKKTLRNDIILIASLLLIAVVSLIVVLSTRQKHVTTAKVYVQNELRLTVDLSKNDEYIIEGTKGQLKVQTKDKGIAVIESSCPHKDCINMGYVYTSNRPIICAYNATYIVIEGTSEYDVEI